MLRAKARRPLDSSSGLARLSGALAFASGIAGATTSALALAAIGAAVLLMRAPRRLRAWLVLPVWFGLGAAVLRAHGAIDPAPSLARAWRLAGVEERATPLIIEGRILDLEALPADRLGITLLLERWSVRDQGSSGPWAKRTARLRLTLPLDRGAPWPWVEGDRVRMSARLGRPRSFRNPSAFDYAAFLEARGIQFTGTVKSPLLVERLESGAWWRSALPALRRAAVARLKDAAGPGDEATSAFLAALLLGERQSLPPRLEESLQRSGVYHIIALSGFNVGLLVLLCSMLLACLPLGGRGRRVLLLLSVLLYWGTARHAGSMARASLMVVIHIAGALLGRRVSSLGALSLSALLLLAWRPAFIADAGFQLSYAATLGLMAVVRSPRSPATRRTASAGTAVRLLQGSMSASGAALIATAPLTAWHFHSLAPSGLVANLIAVPLAAMALTLALLIESLSFWPSGAAAIAAVAGGLLHVLEVAARACAALPGGFLYVLPPPVPLLSALASAIAVLALALRPRTRRLAAAAAAGLMLLVILAGRPPRAPRRFEVIALDVGQGDAVLTRFPNGLTLLSDAGGVLPGEFDLGARVVAPALRGLGLLRIDILAITHAHRDHLGGALSVLRQLRPRALWLGSMPRGDPRVERLMTEAERMGVPIVHPLRGVRLDLGGGRLDVLHPTSVGSLREVARNDDSLVLRIQVGERAVLLTGDAEAGVEAQIADGSCDLSAELLKVAHHGSASSTTPGFLERAAPRVALISVGPANPFHHPAPEVIDRLLRAGACVLRTDRDGAVAATTDGHAPWRAQPLLKDPDETDAASEHLRCDGNEAEHEDDEADEGHDTPTAR